MFRHQCFVVVLLLSSIDSRRGAQAAIHEGYPGIRERLQLPHRDIPPTIAGDHGSPRPLGEGESPSIGVLREGRNVEERVFRGVVASSPLCPSGRVSS